MQISPDISIPICIEQGSVYHFKLTTTNKDGTAYSGDRFFIVLNVNPKTDEVLVLTTITTQTASQVKFIKLNGEDPTTLVSITKSDLPILSQDSVVNCNRVYEKTMQEVIDGVNGVGGKIINIKLPKSVINALVSGVVISKQVPTNIKEFLI